MQNKFEVTYGLDQLDEVAAQINKLLTLPICILKGELGAGKTSLLKSILTLRQVVDEVNSPTYSIVNEYRTEMNETIYHFDLFRIKAEVELYDLGFGEYIDSKNCCFIEWPKIAENMLPVQYHTVQIEYVNFGKRKLTLY